MDKLFVKTKDVETKDLLIANGLQLVNFSNGVYTFLNSSADKFREEVNEKNIVRSNILCV
jgi:hypothetical protein